MGLIRKRYDCQVAGDRQAERGLCLFFFKAGDEMIPCADNKIGLYKTAFEMTQDIILFLLTNGQIIGANQAAANAYGFSYQVLLTMKIYDLRADKDIALINTQIAEICRSPYQFEAVHRRRDGSVFPVEVSAHSQKFGNETVIFAIIRDISERKQVENQLRYLATHDSLTDVPNRYLFEEALQQAVVQAEKGMPSALLFIDLDNFKIVNDTFGHATGDQLLINCVNVIRGVLRKHDILARLGGDEFAVLLNGLTSKEAAIVAEKLRLAVEDEELCLNMYGTYFKLTVSIGIVAINGSLCSRDILDYADAALYAAKGSGKNCIKAGCARLDE